MNSLVQKYKEMAMRQSNVLLEHILIRLVANFGSLSPYNLYISFQFAKTDIRLFTKFIKLENKGMLKS
jgi:hypothetical protein